MKLEHIKNAMTLKVGRQILIAKKNTPTILFAGGVVGVVATTVLASRATLRLEEILDEAEKSHEQARTVDQSDYSEEDRKRDHILIKARAAGKVAKLYTPAIAVGVISVASLTGSHVVLSRRNAAVMAAYSALDKGFNEYRARVRGEFGEDKDRELRYGSETRTETVATEDGGSKTVKRKTLPPGIPSIYAKYFDDGSTSWSREAEYNHFFLNCQQNYANDLLHSRGHIFLNEVYDRLGIPRTKAGAVVGWIMTKDGDNFVDFGVYDETRQRARAFVNGDEGSILLDFNVDGVIYDQLKDD